MGIPSRVFLVSMALCLATMNVTAQQAGPGKPTPDVIIRKMDKDKDGRLSPDEYRHSAQRFRLLDADKDGFVTKSELADALARREPGGGGEESRRSEQHPHAVWYANLPVILTHTHFRPNITSSRGQAYDWPGAERNMLATLDRIGARAAIVMPTPRGPGTPDHEFFDGLVRVAKRHPDRIRIAGGGWSLNTVINSLGNNHVTDRDRRSFTERAKEIIAKGAVGFGETTALHFSLFKDHPFEETQPDHPLFLLLADLAAKHDVPLDLHMEAVTDRTWAIPEKMLQASRLNPSAVGENITAFERLLAHNPKARIIWVHLGADHTGQRSPDLVRRLLAAYPNLFLSITQGLRRSEVYPLLSPGSGLDRRWRDLILDYPDRITIGSDTFFIPEAASRQIGQKPELATLIVRHPFLPPAVARKIAFENAQRIFKLKIINPDDVPLPGGGAAAPAGNVGPAREAGFLSEADVRRAVVGNTVTFLAPANGREIFAHFAEDGTVALRIIGGPGKVIEKSWFFKEGGMLCRTVGQQNREHCARVRAGQTAGSFEFVLPKNRYPAKVLPGRQLPD